MNYLLDTHTCIWAIAEQNKLSPKVKLILQDSKNTFCISKISLFEISIKLKIGKLPEFQPTFSEFVNSIYSSGYKLLPMKDEHLESYNSINFDETHRDPFDRFLLATAHFENLAIITKDEKFQLYVDRFQIIW